MATHSGADLAPVGRLYIDMRIVRWGGGVIGQLGLGLLAVNLMSTHAVNGVPPTPGNVSPTAIVTIAGAPRQWRLQVDEASLAQLLNAWAARQPILPTPLGSARLRDLTVHLDNDELGLRGVADTGWIAEPVAVDATASLNAGRVFVHVREVEVQGMVVPDSARQALEQWLQQQIDQWTAAYHATVQSVHISEGTLVLSGTRQ
jgi:hypothetical protein